MILFNIWFKSSIISSGICILVIYGIKCYCWCFSHKRVPAPLCSCKAGIGVFVHWKASIYFLREILIRLQNFLSFCVKSQHPLVLLSSSFNLFFLIVQLHSLWLSFMNYVAISFVACSHSQILSGSLFNLLLHMAVSYFVIKLAELLSWLTHWYW